MKPLKPHPYFPELVPILRRSGKRLRPWTGTLFRSVELEFARSSKLLDGKGSRSHGSRWSVPGAFRSVSLCDDPHGADQEAIQRATYYGWSADLLRPRLRVAVTAELQKVLTLDEAANAGGTGLPLAELLGEDWRKVNDAGKESLSQALGRAAHEVGVEALRVPSAVAQGAMNLIVFVENWLPKSSVLIENQAELDRWLKKR